MKQSIIFVFALMLWAPLQAQTQPLEITANKRFFQTADKKPFFWLGDTGWLLFIKTTREEAVQYLNTRKEQGFNVIQAMLVHGWDNAANVYGQPSFQGRDVSQPYTTPGNDVNKPGEYDYWDHVEYIIDQAAQRGIYMALVPVWGSAVKDGPVTAEQAATYATWLAKRFHTRNNIIWLNGGDIVATDSMAVWQAIGTALKQHAPHQLVTYHPRGRYTSSQWFHNADWLDFNMFQSGHKTYAQDTSSKEHRHYGEDNWKYVQEDYAKKPAKPTLDGEPSYENIPYGLHDTTLPRWKAADLRRYAYWSVLAGGAGFTYGENHIMQFHRPGDQDANFGPYKSWQASLYEPGAMQMRHLKELILTHTDGSRRPAQEILAANDGKQYDYIIASKGNGYALAYTYTGKPISINIAKLGFKPGKAYWFNPVNGTIQEAGKPAKKGVEQYQPPARTTEGNDWVLILKK
jgi:hypothetical protein